MDKQLFRKASIDRVSSPEQLNDYIRVSDPGIWMILAAVIVLLIGVCVWGVYGRLETKIETAGTCENGVFVCYVTEEKAGKIKTGMNINVDGSTLSVSGISSKPVAANADMDEYLEPVFTRLVCGFAARFCRWQGKNPQEYWRISRIFNAGSDKRLSQRRALGL